MTNPIRFKCTAIDGSTFHWEQDSAQVLIAFYLRDSVLSQEIEVVFKPNSLLVKIKGREVIKGSLCKTIVVDDCCWTLSDNCLEITLVKSLSGTTWEYLLDTCDKPSKNEVENQKAKILLERFQTDHPAFDFGGATFQGNVPDPHTFMR